MGLTTYLVERYLPGTSTEEMRAATARARAASAELAAEGVPVSYLGSTFLPGEETCFCLFEGPSAEAVEEANRRAAIPFAHMSQAVQICTELVDSNQSKESER